LNTKKKSLSHMTDNKTGDRQDKYLSNDSKKIFKMGVLKKMKTLICLYFT